MRSIYLWWLLTAIPIAIPIALEGQTRTPGVDVKVAIANAIMVERVTVESAKNSAVSVARTTIELKNISSKTIYAVAYSAAATYVDGSVETRAGSVDLLPLYFEQSLLGSSKYLPALLHGGETFDCSGPSFPSDARQVPPVSGDASVTALIFEDRTAVGDAIEVQRIMRSRRASSRIDRISCGPSADSAGG
jgi:hypothetical protein